MGHGLYRPGLGRIDAFSARSAASEASPSGWRHPGVAVDGEARQAPDVADTIVAMAEEVESDLIVMSTQALTGPARALLGSVADAVVRRAHCPVLLVHRDEAAPVARPAAQGPNLARRPWRGGPCLTMTG